MRQEPQRQFGVLAVLDALCEAANSEVAVSRQHKRSGEEQTSIVLVRGTERLRRHRLEDSTSHVDGIGRARRHRVVPGQFPLHLLEPARKHLVVVVEERDVLPRRARDPGVAGCREAAVLAVDVVQPWIVDGGYDVPSPVNRPVVDHDELEVLVRLA
jgi:hypothetical protein